MSDQDQNTDLDDNNPSTEDLLKQIEELKKNQKEEPVDSNINDDTVKANIGKAYTERDEALNRIKQLESEKREGELKALEESGKKEEADKMRLEEKDAQLTEAKNLIITLTRDSALKAELNSSEFVSDKASQIAYQDIVSVLIQDAVGNWVSPTGQSIRDYVQFYQNDEANKFLFKVKQSSGSQSMEGNSKATNVTSDKSIKDMSHEEMMAAAEAGKFDDDGNTWL